MVQRTLRRKDFFKSPRSRVTVHREPHQPSTGRHLHEFTEIVIVLSGTGIHEIGRCHHEVSGGDILVINRLQAHRYLQTRGLNLINILIRDDVIPRIARDLANLPGYQALFHRSRAAKPRSKFPHRVRLEPRELEQVEEWANRLEEEALRPGEGGDLLAEAYMTLIVGMMARRYRDSAAGPLRRGHVPLGKLLTWIDKNLERELCVRDLARHVGMSERGFYRAFRENMHQAPMEYVLKTRMRRAVQLLRWSHPKMRIDEIASRCGFPDSNQFSRRFHRETGLTPVDFRKKKPGASELMPEPARPGEFVMAHRK